MLFRSLRLVDARGGNIVVGAGDKVYLVRSGRTYDYDALYAAGVRELKDSGYWVENTNFAGGRTYSEDDDATEPDTGDGSGDGTEPGTGEGDGTEPGTGEGDGAGNGGEEAEGASEVARAAYGEARAFAAPTAQPTALADTTTVVNPGDGSCTADHTALVATGNGDGTHNAVCSDCGYEVTNEECADADGDSRCDLCGDCLHVATTATDNGDGTHKRTCDGCGAETVASEAHIDTNADGKCDGCGADVCKHADVEYTDNFDNTHKKVCKVCKEELSAAEAHVDVKKEDNGRTDRKSVV